MTGGSTIGRFCGFGGSGVTMGSLPETNSKVVSAYAVFNLLLLYIRQILTNRNLVLLRLWFWVIPI